MYKRGQNNDNGILHSAVSIANSRGVLMLVAPHDSREGGRGGGDDVSDDIRLGSLKSRGMISKNPARLH
jgi:hypothetical protein